jgi:hypothetical protein
VPRSATAGALRHRTWPLEAVIVSQGARAASCAAWLLFPSASHEAQQLKQPCDLQGACRNESGTCRSCCKHCAAVAHQPWEEQHPCINAAYMHMSPQISLCTALIGTYHHVHMSCCHKLQCNDAPRFPAAQHSYECLASMRVSIEPKGYTSTVLDSNNLHTAEGPPPLPRQSFCCGEHWTSWTSTDYY